MKILLNAMLSLLLLFANSPHLCAQQAGIDYSSPDNWAVIPANYPASLKAFVRDSVIANTDVFYVYPTFFLDRKDTAWNCNIDDESQHDKILNSGVQYQASAWANAGELYVPYYRQAHIKAYAHLDGRGREAILLAYSDVKSAFEFYLNNYNNGRSIILAGHSQGSTHLTLLLEEFFDNKPLSKQLVAAYLPGVGIKASTFQSIKLMTDPDSIGGFVTWNTFKKRFDTPYYQKWYKGCVSVNPITWDTARSVKRDFHRGFLFTNGELYSKSFKTNAVSGGVWISPPRFPYRYMSFIMKNYHVGDVNLFWEDIRLNARLRASLYQACH